MWLYNVDCVIWLLLECIAMCRSGAQTYVKGLDFVDGMLTITHCVCALTTFGFQIYRIYFNEDDTDDIDVAEPILLSLTMLSGALVVLHVLRNVRYVVLQVPDMISILPRLIQINASY